MTLEREDMEVLILIQSLVGCITENMRLITLECNYSGTCIWFLLERDNDCDREEVEDVIAEFGGTLNDCQVPLNYRVICDERPICELHLPGRVVYARKE